LRLDHAALVKAERTETVIKEIYRRTAVVDGFRVEGCQKDIARIEVATPTLTRRSGGNESNRAGGSSCHLVGLEQFQRPRVGESPFPERQLPGNVSRPFLRTSGDIARPLPQVLHQTAESKNPQHGGSEIALDRLSISGNATTHGENSASSLESHGQEGHGEGEEELLIEF
jgi:hypothetical protein